MTPEALHAIYTEKFAPWIQALQITPVEVAEDTCLFRMPLTPELMRVGGIVSGQALAALADTTMVLGAVAHAGEFRPFATTNLDTQFLRPGTGTAILCQTHILRAGRAIVFARAEMRQEDSGKPVAAATATFFAP